MDLHAYSIELIVAYRFGLGYYQWLTTLGILQIFYFPFLEPIFYFFRNIFLLFSAILLWRNIDSGWTMLSFATISSHSLTCYIKRLTMLRTKIGWNLIINIWNKCTIKIAQNSIKILTYLTPMAPMVLRTMIIVSVWFTCGPPRVGSDSWRILLAS